MAVGGVGSVMLFCNFQVDGEEFSGGKLGDEDPGGWMQRLGCEEQLLCPFLFFILVAVTGPRHTSCAPSVSRPFNLGRSCGAALCAPKLLLVLMLGPSR